MSDIKEEITPRRSALLQFFTGSRKRPSLPLLRWCSDPLVFVEPQELDEYRTKHPTLSFATLPKNDGGFSYLMNQMVRHTLEAGRRYFFFVDDDVTDLKSRATLADKFRRVPDVSLQGTLGELLGLATDAGLAQLAISFAGQSWAAKKAIQENVGAWGAHLTDASAVRAVGGYDESLPCFGDWDMSARLILAGHRTARTNLVTFVHKMKSQPGGAADVYARRELVREAAHRVAAKFPGCATVKFVPSHGLDEVRFNWRKLVAAGSAGRSGSLE
jgi:GT2 family glycosyltransferase